MSLPANQRIILPLDVPDSITAVKLADELGPFVGMFKVGMELFYSRSGGHSLVDAIATISDRPVFLDLKLKDIPNTMKGAVVGVRDLPLRFLTVHVDDDIEAEHLAAALVAANGKFGLLGVTLLTSVEEKTLWRYTGVMAPSNKEVVSRRAEVAVAAGCEGVVCSGQELATVRDLPLLKIVPGTRPTWAAANDQKRVVTPTEAIQSGADYLVIGRPITNPPDGMTRQQAAERVIEEITAAMA